MPATHNKRHIGKVDDRPWCACKCGLRASPGKTYRQGHNIAIPRNGRNNIGEEVRRQIPALWATGLSRNAIAAKLGVAHITVTRNLMKAGVDPERRDLLGERHKNWTGGRVVSSDGYVQVYVAPNDPLVERNGAGRAAEHRVVMARHLGRRLYPDETVHHKNGIRDDNRIENLELWVKRQPYGQRVEDRIEDAVALLRRYAPDLLT